jgi:hypothetical protein
MIWARNPLLIRHVLRDHATSAITRTRGCFAFATVSLITSHRSTRHADEGGEWLIQGNYKDRKWDYLVEEGYLERRSATPALDAVAYVLTATGRAAST